MPYKGTGTINGEGPYKFMLTAIDGELFTQGSPDYFRIKIWGEDELGNETIVYDNMPGDNDDADPVSPNAEVIGGSIVIHKGN